MSARILLVDDEPHIRTVMRVALEHSAGAAPGGGAGSSGYEIGEASSGEEALERFHDGPRWDLVLLDERMPGIDGLETLRRLKQDERDVAVIMITAFASIELAVEAMRLGATDFMRKPMTPETLRAAVDGALAKARGEWVSVDAEVAAAAIAPRPFEIGMFNGFRLRHVSAGETAADQRFDVMRHAAPEIGAGATRRILVRIAPDVVRAASEAAGWTLDEDEPFWVRQAAFALARYVWDYADVPPDGLLLVTKASPDLLVSARNARRP